jgi:hypothetical protein
MPGAKAGRLVADGGPSLAGTWGDIDKESHVAAVNGSLGFARQRRSATLLRGDGCR